MRVHFISVIVLLLVALTPVAAAGQGQDQYEIKLTIDTTCICNNSLNSKLKGKFEIYANVSIRRNYTDTLIRELKIKKEQTIALTQGNYKFIYTPSDSRESTNQFYFSIYPSYNEAIHLNCFFFNKRYQPLLEQMKEKDTLVIISTYVGNYYEGMLIPSHTVVIFKNQNKYYASYINSEYRQGDVEFVVATKSFKMPKYESQISLNEEGIEKIKAFDANLSMVSINDNFNYYDGVKNVIMLNGKNITFNSKWYSSLLLWDEINKTNH
ncbi:hypothetical protein D3C87_39570 [compost metagenome]